MNTLRNKVNLIGHVGQKPELQTLSGGYLVTRFSIATNESFKNKNGEWQEKTQWHSIAAWGKLAERIVKQSDKGSELVIEGRLIHKKYESKDGETRYATEIELSEFMLIGKKS